MEDWRSTNHMYNSVMQQTTRNEISNLQECSLVLRKVIQRYVDVFCLLTDNHGVSMAERSPSHVLSTESNVEACVEKRGEYGKDGEREGEGEGEGRGGERKGRGGGDTLVEQTSKCKGLSRGPVNGRSCLHLLQPLLHVVPLQAWVHLLGINMTSCDCHMTTTFKNSTLRYVQIRQARPPILLQCT